MPSSQDGPTSKHFTPLPFSGNAALGQLGGTSISAEMAAATQHAPSGHCAGWGIPFDIGNAVLLTEQTISIDLPPTTAPWLIFMHTSDLRPNEPGPGGFISPMRGEGQLGEHAADYVILYGDGTEERVTIRRRFQLGTFQRR